ncbi:MAG: flagellar hook-associated protein FlgK [Acidobacteria bacterium]|nr:flagellar hook-associated protein FlgK [Acidobacteriota bacterium]
MGVNFSVFEIGRRALRAGQLGVSVTSNNIANVNTPGYSRQTVQLSAAHHDPANGRLVGTGVNVDGVKSIRDQFIATRLQTETAINGRLSAQRDTLTPVETAFNELDGSGGINAAVKSFFGAFRDLEANPASTALRTSVVERGNVLASAFHSTRDRLVEIRNDADQNLRAELNNTNELSIKIAELNRKIRLTENSGANAADLVDQRAVALQQIAELTGARTTTNDDNTVTVTLGNGQALVYGDQAATLTAEDTPPDGLATIKLDGQATTINDGKLRGIQDAVNDISGYLQSLDDLASSVAGRVNTLHAAGVDLDNNAGGAFFVSSNGGAITAETFDVSAALNADSRQVVATASGAGGGDGSVARSIANLLSDKTSVAGTRTGSFTDIYGSIVAEAGQAVKTAEDELTTQSAILAQTQAQRDSISGVSLDEEAINLLQYQKAYEAAARFLKVADEMTQTILQLGQ